MTDFTTKLINALKARDINTHWTSGCPSNLACSRGEGISLWVYYLQDSEAYIKGVSISGVDGFDGSPPEGTPAYSNMVSDLEDPEHIAECVDLRLRALASFMANLGGFQAMEAVHKIKHELRVRGIQVVLCEEPLRFICTYKGARTTIQLFRNMEAGSLAYLTFSAFSGLEGKEVPSRNVPVPLSIEPPWLTSVADIALSRLRALRTFLSLQEVGELPPGAKLDVYDNRLQLTVDFESAAAAKKFLALVEKGSPKP